MSKDSNLDRTREERVASLEKAKAARRARADAKAKLKSGEVSVEEFFAMADNDAAIARMPVAQFLRAMPGIGAARAASIMAQIGISDSRRIGGLGNRQKTELIETLAK
jgi:hypothetical protein